MESTLPTTEREPRTVLARPDDGVIIVRRDATLRGSIALSVDHVPGADPVPVILVGPTVALDDVDGVLHGWLHSIATGRKAGER